ncbi:hypothetical protein [Rhizorhabdus dicambivorans]|uniref:hypothetical protein n=1 Tax=Rhizorhabdus dicambivorans TaxID=1850238 RepID=UPI0011123395|nr:hypothetical protein [Rhizorhabdus dicambivorans]
MFRIYPPRRSNIKMLEGGFSVCTAAGIDTIMLANIKAVSIYKRDEFIVDRVCCDIETVSKGQSLVRMIHEEMAGFHEAMAKLEELPGFYRYWREAVILPAFLQNHTELYREGHDFSKLGADKPPGRERDPEESGEKLDIPKPNKLKFAAIFVAILVFVVTFHIMMD